MSGRLVWIEDGERIALLLSDGPRQACARLLADRYDSALQYPAEAIAQILCPAEAWFDDQSRSECRRKAKLIVDLLRSEA